MDLTLVNQSVGIWGEPFHASFLPEVICIITVVIARRAGISYQATLTIALAVLGLGISSDPLMGQSPYLIATVAVIAGLDAGIVAWRSGGRAREACVPIGVVVPLLLVALWGWEVARFQGAIVGGLLGWMLACDFVPLAGAWLWTRGSTDLRSVRAGSWAISTLAGPALAITAAEANWARAFQSAATLAGAWGMVYLVRSEVPAKLDRWIEAGEARVLSASAAVGIAYPIIFAFVLNQVQSSAIHRVVATLDLNLAGPNWLTMLGVFGPGVAYAMKKATDRSHCTWLIGVLGVPTVLWAVAAGTAPAALVGPARLVVLVLVASAAAGARLNSTPDSFATAA